MMPLLSQVEQIGNKKHVLIIQALVCVWTYNWRRCNIRYIKCPSCGSAISHFLKVSFFCQQKPLQYNICAWKQLHYIVVILQEHYK
jgi:hypothetical protein